MAALHMACLHRSAGCRGSPPPTSYLGFIDKVPAWDLGTLLAFGASGTVKPAGAMTPGAFT